MIIRSHIQTLLLLLSFLTSFGQKPDPRCLLAFSDSSSGEQLWGFKTPSGKIAIKPKYNNVLGSDTLYDIAFVTLNYKWVAINKKDSIVLTPFIFDNGPDYVEEGLFRFVENQKIGFANLKGQKVIPANFDFANPFSEGLSSFNIGGERRKWDDEHWTWTGGLWGFINKNGKVVIQPKFTNAYNFNGGHCEVWTKENKHILIDKRGNLIKLLKD